MPMITIDDFAKLDIRIGTILSAEKVPEADRLLRFSVDVGEEAPRQILSGIAEYFSDPNELVGRQVPVIVNLAPRIIRGIESQGMILYAVGENILTTLSPAREVTSGTRVK